VTYLLDTNICIGWMRQNQPQIVARIQAQTPGDIVLCSVVVRGTPVRRRTIRPGPPGQHGPARGTVTATVAFAPVR
jgi:hypothetical protein